MGHSRLANVQCFHRSPNCHCSWAPSSSPWRASVLWCRSKIPWRNHNISLAAPVYWTRPWSQLLSCMRSLDSLDMFVMEMTSRAASRWICQKALCKYKYHRFPLKLHWRISTFHSSIAQVAQVLIAVAILFTFALQFYVPCDILWRKLQPRIPKEKHNISQILFRAGLILIMGGVAAAVPKLEPFIGLVGAVFFSILGELPPIDLLLIPNSHSIINCLHFAWRSFRASRCWNGVPVSRRFRFRQMEIVEEYFPHGVCDHCPRHWIICQHVGNYSSLFLILRLHHSIDTEKPKPARRGQLCDFRVFHRIIRVQILIPIVCRPVDIAFAFLFRYKFSIELRPSKHTVLFLFRYW